MALPSSLTGYSVVVGGVNYGAVKRIAGLQYAIVLQGDGSYACFTSPDGKVWTQFGDAFTPPAQLIGFATIYRTATNDFMVAGVDQAGQTLNLNFFSVTDGTWATTVTQAYSSPVALLYSSAEIDAVGDDYLILFWASNARSGGGALPEVFFALLSTLATPQWLTSNIPYGPPPPSLDALGNQIASYDLSFDGSSYVLCVCTTAPYAWKQAFALDGTLGAFALLTDGDSDATFITSFQWPGFQAPE